MSSTNTEQAKKMNMPLAKLVENGLICRLRASYIIDKSLFDECLKGLPAFTNCLISGLNEKGESEVAYFIPQGGFFDKKELIALFYKPYSFELIFFDAMLNGVPIFGMPDIKTFDVRNYKQFQAFRAIVQYENNHSHFLKDHVIRATLEKITLYLLRELKEHHAPVFENLNNYFENARLLKVLTYIHENMREELTLERLGELVELSPDYISQFFKRCVGMSIQSYLIDQRVKKGLHLLVSSNEQISAISDLTGFVDQAYFNRRFKIFYKINPLRLRKQYQLLFISRAGSLLTSLNR